MDDLEKKKWIISRADIIFNLQRQMIREKENEINQFREFEVSRWKKLEKQIISVFVSGIGIIVGLHEIYPTTINWGMPLFLISAIGLCIYFPAIIFRHINTKIFDDIVSSNIASKSWHYSYGRFTQHAIDIEQYNSNDFRKFLEYYKLFVIVASELSLYISLKKQNKMRNLLFLSMPAVQKLADSKKSLKNFLDNTSKKYEEMRKDYESIPIISDLLIYGNALSRYENGIMIIPKPNIKNTDTASSQDLKLCSKWIKKLFRSSRSTNHDMND